MTSPFYVYINLSNVAILSMMLVGTTQLVAKNKNSRLIFILSIAFAIAENLCDSFWILGTSKKLLISDATLKIINALYFITFCVSSYFWFALSELSFKKTLLKTKVGFICSLVPFVGLVALLIVNAFNGCLYTFDASGAQVKSDLFYLQQVLSCSYTVAIAIKHIALANSVVKRKDKIELFILFAFCVPTIVCAIIQVRFQSLPILSSTPVFSVLALYSSLLLKQARTDRLTGLSNGELFVNKTRKRIRGLKNNQNLYVVFIDIDSFKSLNDTYGHLQGNRILSFFADFLNKICLKNDAFCVRYGGDEFAVLQTLDADKNIADVIEEIQNIKQESLKIFGYPVFVSVGYSVFDKETDNADRLIMRADENMYKVKREKRMNNNHENQKTQSSDLERFYQAMREDVHVVMQQLDVTEAVLKEFLKKFPADKSFDGLERALSEDDVETAFREAHTLKGIAANLGLQRLFEIASTVTEFLRADNMTDAKIEMPVLSQEYKTVCELIRKLG